MERELDVRTGEAVTVRFELAGLGSRFLALALDLTIQTGVVVAAFIVLALLSGPINAALSDVPLDRHARAVLAAVAIAVTFLWSFGYFVYFELAWNGVTPGKRVFGLRVVRDEGIPIDAGAAAVRNLVRFVEFVFGCYVFSALVMIASSQNKRPGDYAAGTIVIRERHADAPVLDGLLREEPRRDDGLDAEDDALIAQFLARRAQLTLQARRDVAAGIARRVRPKLRASFDHLDDEALLEHVGRPLG